MTECNSRMNRRIEEVEKFLANPKAESLPMTMFSGERRRLEKCFSGRIVINAIAKTDIEGLIKCKIEKIR